MVLQRVGNDRRDLTRLKAGKKARYFNRLVIAVLLSIGPSLPHRVPRILAWLSQWVRTVPIRARGMLP